MKTLIIFFFISQAILSCNVHELVGIAENKVDPKLFNHGYGNGLVFLHSGDFFVGKTMPTYNEYTTIQVKNNSSDITYEVLDGVLTSTDTSYSGGVFPGTGGTCVFAAILQPGQTCTINIDFNPSSVAYYNGTFDLKYKKVDSSKHEVLTTAIKGEGVSVKLAPETGDINFSPSAVGAVEVYALVITFDGIASAPILSTSFSSPQFNYQSGSYPGVAGDCLDPISSSCNLAFEFTAPAVGVTNGEMTIVYDNGLYNDELKYNLQGIGLGPASLSVSLANVNFGNVPAGGSLEHTLTLTNNGGSTATAISGYNLAAPFEFTGGSFPGGGTCTASLAAGASCNFKVRFSPSGATGVANGIAKFDYFDGSVAQTVNMNVVGDAKSPASLTISESDPYDYGLIATTGSASHTFVVTNLGGYHASSFSEVGLAAPYSVSGSSTCGSTLMGGASCNLVVDFTPGSTGVASDQINISFNDGVSSSSALRSVTGTGADPATIDVTPALSWDYGSVSTAGSQSQTFTLNNSGTLTATSISGMLLTNSQFRFVGGTYPGTGGTCGASLAAAGTCTIVVLFDPTTVGLKTDTVQISFNDGGSATNVNINLQGTGI